MNNTSEVHLICFWFNPSKIKFDVAFKLFTNREMCHLLQSLGQQSTVSPQQRRSNLSGTLREHFRLREIGLHVCRLYYVGTPDSHISPEHQLCKTFLQPTYNICASEHNSASALVTVKIGGDEPLKTSAWSAWSPTSSHLHPSFTEETRRTNKQTWPPMILSYHLLHYWVSLSLSCKIQWNCGRLLQVFRSHLRKFFP